MSRKSLTIGKPAERAGNQEVTVVKTKKSEELGFQGVKKKNF